MTTFNWTISQMNRTTSDGFVFNVHYAISAVDGQYSAYTYGTKSYTQEPGANYVPYNELTQDMVIAWVQASLDKDAVEASLQAQIDLQKNPVEQAGVPWAVPTAGPADAEVPQV